MFTPFIFNDSQQKIFAQFFFAHQEEKNLYKTKPELQIDRRFNLKQYQSLIVKKTQTSNPNLRFA